MKTLKWFMLFLCVGFILSSCSKDEDTKTPLVVNFEATITSQAPMALVSIVNSTTGADEYSWTFGEGADYMASTEKTPPTITVDKAGSFTITLTAKNGEEEKTETKTLTIPGNSAIISYEDVEFATEAGNTTYGRFFSTASGQMFLDSEVNATNGPTIDLVFGQLGTPVNFFDTPDNSDYSIPGATNTKVMNNPSDPPISSPEFSFMHHDELLKDLVITNDNESFGASAASGDHIVLFENADGKKGAIMTKAINNDRILVDIKVQKY
ncbi:MAG: PKD domain-containing protein [Bacteroidales bacterium]|nr:PKD domain-containing protein [Bacteroidales bacterium]